MKTLRERLNIALTALKIAKREIVRLKEEVRVRNQIIKEKENYIEQQKNGIRETFINE
jgi:hypothetical protein